MICLPKSPTEIKTEYLVDVFETGAANMIGDAAILDAIKAACWRRFRHRAIGDYDYEYWLEILTDRMTDAWEEYKYKCDIYKDRVIWDLNNSKTDESRTNHADNTSKVTVDADTTNTVTYNLTNSNDGSSQSEDMPDTPVVAGQEYLSRRENNNNTATQTGTTGTVASDGQIVDTIGNVTGGATATITNQSGLTVELLNKVYDGIRNPFKDYAKELDNLFMNRW